MRFNDNTAMIGIIVIAVLGTCKNYYIQYTCVVIVILILCASMIRHQHNTFNMNIIQTDAVNESLIIEGKLCQKKCLFMIDTGYAGPPVISSSYLAINDDSNKSVKERYNMLMKQLERGVDVDKQNKAIDSFINKSACFSFTSGCTMRLMGIGSTQEQQADMLLCEMLQIKTVFGLYASPKRFTSEAHADVFVTNSLPTSVHILTCDYLIHSSPAHICISKNELHLNLSLNEEYLLKSKMHMHPLSMSGGSFVVVIEVGDAKCRCTVDTGSPGPICISQAASKKIKNCKGKSRLLNQSGVNGEQVCSQIITTSVKFGNTVYPETCMFVNNTEIDQVDGYIGMGFLRAFDILVTPSGIGFMRNGLDMKQTSVYELNASYGKCQGLEAITCGTE